MHFRIRVGDQISYLSRIEQVGLKDGQKPNYKKLILYCGGNIHAAAAKDAKRSQRFLMRPLREKKFTANRK